MPYINKEARKNLLDNGDVILNSGELNYMITNLIKKYLESQGESYRTYNDIVGALEGAKLELYRRKIAPYEDDKIDENGDVF